jgi:xanthine/CO dehydrogenase XdhC/CoxF family maturation factor
MQEIAQIVKAFEIANKQGKKTALTTVVHVSGSSYRRPGARMLVTEDGIMTGAISGGCLEGDALRKAALAISQGKNKLVIYDTTDEDDAKLGIQLGCNGIVSILFEPIFVGAGNNPIHALETVIAKRDPSLIITLFSKDQQKQLGTFCQSSLPAFVRDLISEEIELASGSRKSIHKELWIEGEQNQCFIEFCEPTISLVIVGAGNDAIPLSKIASVIGWNIAIVDGRFTHANPQRFPTINQIQIGTPQEIIDQFIIDGRTAFVLMTHNYNYDLSMLEHLQGKDFGYIGLLGPALKRDRMFEELEQKGIIFSEQEMGKIFGPTGLNLGAETAEEIALSICSEIMSFFNNTIAIQLREKLDPIHLS